MTTLYLSNADVTVNGLAANSLAASAGSREYGGAVEDSSYAATLYSHAQVSVRASGGSETVIGAYGSAQTSQTSEGSRNATWACPATAMGGTDSVVVRFGSGLSSAATTATVAFTTAQGPGSLAATSWTLYRYMRLSDTGDYLVWQLAYGDTGVTARIENVTFEAGGATVCPLSLLRTHFIPSFF